MTKCFISLLVILAASMFAVSVKANDSSLVKDESLIRLSSLPSVDLVTQRVLAMLNKAVGTTSPDDVRVSRIYTSDLYSVQFGPSEYITDSNASYWVKAQSSEVFLFGKDVVQVNIGNDVRESMLSLTSMLNFFDDTLVIYKPLSKNKNEIIYAFMDLSCPFCKRFHLSQRVKLQMEGYTVVYIPFLRDIDDKKARALTMLAFCLRGDERQSFIDDAFLALNVQNALSAGLKKYPSEKCDKVQDSIYESLISLSHQYNLTGSPVFFTEQGKLFYGFGALEKSVLH